MMFPARFALAVFVICSLLRASPGAHAADEPRPELVPTEESIRLFESRVKKNPKDFRSRTALGRLYMRQAKESDDFSGFGRAERAFRAALELEPAYTPARSYLASCLAAQHKFAEAVRLSRQVLEESPKSTLDLATLGDASLEMGEYAEARRAYDRLAERGRTAAVLVRLARLEELNGEPDKALGLIRDALKQHREAGGLESRLAWYEWRLGKLLFENGRLDEAERRFLAALEADPDDAQSLVSLGRVLAAKGDFDGSLSRLKRAVELSPEPPFFAALGDVHAKMGDEANAKKYLDLAEAGMAEEAKDPDSGSAHRREVSLFLSAHDRDPEKALELARAELAARRDIHTHDALAWALYRNERYGQAKESIQKALELGTKDATLYFHAGMIHLALGERDRAREFLTRALDTNPHFSLRGADEARAALKTLAD